jgi:phospholipase/lecithinase/hemolysin
MLRIRSGPSVRRCKGSLGVYLILLTLLVLDGCGSSPSVTTATEPGSENSNPFTSVVFLGDSLTAGYQNGSLLDTQQPNGFANLIAQQAKFSITLPLIAPPGAPPVLQLVSVGFPPVVEPSSGTTSGRDNGNQQATDLAVPGQNLHDLINSGPTPLPSTDQEIITNLVLGYPAGNTSTQLQEAVALKPSAIFLWIGNNDALVADDAGSANAMTPLASFSADYAQLITTLKSTGARLVVANIPDVTLIPYMTPAATVINYVASKTGQSASDIGTALGLADGDLVTPQGLDDVESELSAYQQGTPLKPLGDADVLTAAERVAVQSLISSYNQVIQQDVSAAGGSLVDMHSYFTTLGSGLTIDGQMATTAFLGGLFGLDGIHPTNTGYALLANQFIAATNTAFTLSIAPVDVNAVAKADPYFGSNIKATGNGVWDPSRRIYAITRIDLGPEEVAHSINCTPAARASGQLRPAPGGQH